MPPKTPTPSNHWLVKAEPDTRLEKGKDVKFSIDDFKRCQTTEWDGVRNHQAKGFLKEGMKKGQQVLFYHSNCKEPGVYGTCEVLVEGHPDESAFDPSHPYYDPKSNRQNPTWFCPTLSYVSTLTHPVTLGMLKYLAGLKSDDSKGRGEMGLDYLTKEDHEALTAMPLVGKGRLSVQPVSDSAHGAILLMGARGGWVARSVKGPWVASSVTDGGADSSGSGQASSKGGKAEGVVEEEEEEEKEEVRPAEGERRGKKKRPSITTSTPPTPTTSTKEEKDEPRRSKRTKL